MNENEKALHCEELRLQALNGGPATAASPGAGASAWEVHLAHCADCAAYQQTQRELHSRLRELAEETSAAEAPLHVEALLRREVVALAPRQASPWNRRGLSLAVLAAATVLLVAVLLRQSTQPVANLQAPPSFTPPPEPSESLEEAADNATAVGDFVLLPGAIPDAGDDSAVLRVRLQRSELSAMGLPVNEEASADWVLVDLLVAADGQPEAVRLLR